MDHELRLWNPDGTPVSETLRGHRNPVKGVTIHSDRQVVSFDNHFVHVWDLDKMSGAALPVDGKAVLCDGKNVVAARSGRPVVYDLQLG
jgi:hypothetical protein